MQNPSLNITKLKQYIIVLFEAGNYKYVNICPTSFSIVTSFIWQKCSSLNILKQTKTSYGLIYIDKKMHSLEEILCKNISKILIKLKLNIKREFHKN